MKRKCGHHGVSHLLVHLGWVDFDLNVPSFFPAAYPLLPNSHQPKLNQADSGVSKSKLTQSRCTSCRGVLIPALDPDSDQVESGIVTPLVAT